MFRFIEFWMGICYIKPNDLDATLIQSIEASHQSLSPNNSNQDNTKTNGSDNEANATIPHVYSQDVLPPWLRQEHGKSK